LFDETLLTARVNVNPRIDHLESLHHQPYKDPVRAIRPCDRTPIPNLIVLLSCRSRSFELPFTNLTAVHFACMLESTAS
jgi:hypothetical protein